jgi:hypothetical protein
MPAAGFGFAKLIRMKFLIKNVKGFAANLKSWLNCEFYGRSI